MFDPITRIILESQPYEWSSDEKSDYSDQSDLLNLNLANSNALGDDLLMDALGLDSDLASLQADVMAFDARVSAFLQELHG